MSVAPAVEAELRREVAAAEAIAEAKQRRIDDEKRREEAELKRKVALGWTAHKSEDGQVRSPAFRAISQP